MGIHRLHLSRGPACIFAALAALLLTVGSAGAASAAPRVLHVAPTGSDAGACTMSAPCKTIGHAVAVAGAGERIAVVAGSYAESVTITKPVQVVGVGKPVLDATGHMNGFVLVGAGATGAAVRGFVVEGADQEGIIALRTSSVTISNNVVRGNNRGVTATHPKGECAAQGEVPGDCGEGIHLMSVTHSKVLRNTVTGNLGGILLTDEFGPTAGNLISKNHVFRNLYDCGITVASHSDRAISPAGQREPDLGGIYGNRIVGNISDGNGTKGEGAGILLAAAAPGGAVYNNHVTFNEASGNGLPGITLHSHAPMQDISGNVIAGNHLSNNALTANKGQPGDPDAGLTRTANILVFSAVVPVSVTIRGNTLDNADIGVWLSPNVSATDLPTNTFGSGVGVRVWGG
jgi:parallel beta-helix repeat protein